MDFSVLMSVYKNSDIFETKQAIESVLYQSKPPVQIVIVLDGPLSDGLTAFMDDYRNNPLFTIVPLKRNVGLGNALNVGLNYCKYEYVARMDSDDISVLTRFESQTKFLEAHPEIDALGGQIAEYDENMERELCVRNAPLTMERIRKMAPYRNPINHMTVMFKKSQVLKAGNYEHCPYHEDYYLWLRMMKNGCQMANLDEILVHVRTGEGMLRRRGGAAFIKDTLYFERKALELGAIRFPQFVANVIARSAVSLMPLSLRDIFYHVSLRQASGTRGGRTKSE